MKKIASFGITMFTFLFIVQATLMLTGCGTKKKRVVSTKIATVKGEKLEIGGPLADYIELVDKPFQISTEPWGDNDEYNAKIIIQLKAKKAIPADLLKNKFPQLLATMLDANGTPVAGVTEFSSDRYSGDAKLISLLTDGKGEAFVELSCTTGGYNPEKNADNVKKLKLASLLVELTKEEKSNSGNSIDENKSDNASSSSSSASDGDCVKFAESYGKFVDQYIKIYKSYMKDPSNTVILKEYTELLKTAEKMNNQKDQNTNCMDNGDYRDAIMKHAQRLAEGISGK